MAQQSRHAKRTGMHSENPSDGSWIEESEVTPHGSKVFFEEIRSKARAWAAGIKQIAWKMRSKGPKDSRPQYFPTERVDQDLDPSRQQKNPPFQHRYPDRDLLPPEKGQVGSHAGSADKNNLPKQHEPDLSPHTENQHSGRILLFDEPDTVDSPEEMSDRASNSGASEDNLSPDVVQGPRRPIPAAIPRPAAPRAKRSRSSLSSFRSKKFGFEAHMRIYVPGDIGNKRAQPRYGLIDTGSDCSITYQSVIDKLLGHAVIDASKRTFNTLNGKVESVGVVSIIWRLQGQVDDFKTTVYVLPDPKEDAMIPDFDFLLGRDWIGEHKVLKRNSRIFGRAQLELHQVELRRGLRII